MDGVDLSQFTATEYKLAGWLKALNCDNEKSVPSKEGTHWYHHSKAGLGVWSVYKKGTFDLQTFYSWKQDPLEYRWVTLKMAREMVDLLRNWQPALSPTWVITCPPQGASKIHTKDGIYPAGFLAKEVSNILGLDFVETLVRQEEKRRHHPMASLEQKPYIIIKNPATVTLIIDDMASSGNTMRLSLQALRNIDVPAFGFVWIG